MPINADLLKQVTESRRFRESTELVKYLDYLVANRDNEDNLTESAIRDHFGKGIDSNAVRTNCSRIREALHYHFCYSWVGIRSQTQLRLGNDEGVGYRLEAGPDLHPLRATEAFWQRHLTVWDAPKRSLVRPQTLIIYTEPIMFRDRKNRFFIRHLDVNEFTEGQPELNPKQRLIEKLPWLKEEDLVQSRAYVPGGEVLAKDVIQETLQSQAQTVAKSGKLGIPSNTNLIKHLISREVKSTADPLLKKQHLVLVGSPRTNWLIREVQERRPLRCVIGDFGIDVGDLDANQLKFVNAQIRRVVKRTQRLNLSEIVKVADAPGQGYRLTEDWSSISFALVTRDIGLDKGSVVTVITANQGRGIQAVAERLLAREPVADLLECFGLSKLGRRFQMMFVVGLTDEESRCSDLQPLFYVDSDSQEMHMGVP